MISLSQSLIAAMLLESSVAPSQAADGDETREAVGASLCVSRHTMLSIDHFSD
ncbi:MAG: hypothetical protein AAGI89_14800 [Pseudomonadota bacterium]